MPPGPPSQAPSLGPEADVHSGEQLGTHPWSQHCATWTPALPCPRAVLCQTVPSARLPHSGQVLGCLVLCKPAEWKEKEEKDLGSPLPETTLTFPSQLPEIHAAPSPARPQSGECPLP